MITNIIVVTMLAQLVLASRDIEEPPISFSLEQNSLVAIPVFLNGRGPYRFLLDTGATKSLLSSVVASRLNIRTTSPQALITASGVAAAAIGSIDSVQVGTVRLVRTQIAVVDPHFLRSLHVDGIIGADFLKQFKISIDYTHKILSIAH